ncbi:glycerol-3-phosphate acyltransferase 2, mitochondrial isoform X1 [Pygocentrus nattereri]|uniref:GPAT/DHAPAT C-terminal domain-containing protein n=1 Tax=Pygocentrus nattereri TaxID=42514 RepID=A0AAR2JK44_PYGNA|nr:glycerol-3-phosphate acyltransferase 2, mitochondrial isoform X1 [Pygocentrus nattereri]XP_037391939.1 glycerol-3-phosphate acyltransferase 2, mitochondrial isoform X1 [Pygocentrus nattereri]XP_037391940.1 glycerol-3-phosphate acyltransferase 2, mitochondrial isoform X1 [Pygocentrus nattereri]XP_037391941.1 glycerol-3-phosphate acyltransferase 2, mitochondrial isoform X1 [Pygocentrus nattereri]
MSHASGDASTETPTLPQLYQPKQPALSWGAKIRKKLKAVAPFLGKFRPLVGQCCHQCTPESLGQKLLHKTPSLGFQNLLCVKETHTRYRGWLVRRVCCVLFVLGRKVYASSVGDRVNRIYSTERLMPAGRRDVREEEEEEQRAGGAGRIVSVLQTVVSPALLRLASWMLLKLFRLMFYSVQVNLNQLATLHRATQLNGPLVYVYIRQSALDQALISLTLFFHNLRVPYSVCPVQVRHGWIRAVLQKLGVILLPQHAATEQQAETDSSYSLIMTSLIGELLRAGESLSINVCVENGHGGQWLARVRQTVTQGLVPAVSLVPVGISYDCPPQQDTLPQASMWSVLRFVFSLLSGDHRGGVRIHFAQPFSLMEMCDSGKCRVDGRCPLQELLMPVIQHNRMDSIFGQKDVSWLLPPTYLPELPQAEREMTIALTLHLIHSVTSSMAVMSTGIVSCLILHKHRRGVRLSVLCKDVCWLLEEVLFRNFDVGFAGSLVEVVYFSLSLLCRHLLLAAVPPAGDPVLTARPEPNALLTLCQQCELLTLVFIHEAVGACAVSAMLREVAGCGGGGEMEFDVVLGQEELTEKSLQLTHLLPVGLIPPCQTAHSFALDAVDSMVRCGILIMEEVPRATPVCDYWRRQGVLSWTATDDPDQSSDSDCEEQDKRSYKLSQPPQCPELLFFLCSLLSTQLRALCWTIESLHLLPLPLTESVCVTQLHTHLRNRAQLDKVHHESSSIKLVRMTVRTLTDLGVLIEDRQTEGVYLDTSPVFLQPENKQKLLHFVSQFLYS